MGAEQVVLRGRGRLSPGLLLSVRPTPRGGGLAEFQGGWVSNPPPPPGVGWDLVGALGSIEPVPLLSFFCCRFRVTCLFMVCLHVIAYHVCMPTPIKGLGCIVICVKCEGGNAKTPQLLCLPHAHSWVRGWVGGWVGVRPPPGGGDICRSVGMPKFWVGGSLN